MTNEQKNFSELNKQTQNLTIVYKYDEKLLRYVILFKDILTCFSLNILNLVVLGITTPKIR